VISEIDHRLFGSFAEHMGRSIYGGIFDPGDPRADAHGFRTDVLELVKELGVTIVRYPGGNFLSGYDWRDGVGPVAQRPQRLDLAWHSLETNEFGLDEFMKWCAVANIEPMMAANLGTRGLKEALELLEYCNADGTSSLAAYRGKNGHPEPHGVTVWCLGNEPDGPWQLGHKSASEYGRIAAEVARGMRMIDPTLELVACGSSSRQMPTFGTWENTVLEETYELVDYISMHAYYEFKGDAQSFLASATDLDAYIDELCAVADSVKARMRTDKVMYLSLDEWNVWYQSRLHAALPVDRWDKAPRLSEDDYTVADAVVVGNLLVSILRRSDRVKMACLAQLVNTIATIRADPGEPAWRQTTFWPFSLMAKNARGSALVTRIESPKISTAQYGAVDLLDAIGTFDESTSEAAFFLVNRAVDQPVEACVELRGFGPLEVIEHVTLNDPDLTRSNSADNTTAVAPVAATDWSVEGPRVRADLPPASWNMIRVRFS
jgi:alpha-N-arabinofuranosidase